MLSDSDSTSADFTGVPTTDFRSGFTGVPTIDFHSDFTGVPTTDFPDFTDVPATEFHPRRISARDLHRYVWGLMAVLSAFAISYPIACWRVSQSAQFRPYGSHVKSLPIPMSGSARKYDGDR
jgi:hypothetical protein